MTSKTAKHEDFHGKEYQFYILKALKNGEGEHDFRLMGRRARVVNSLSIDEELANKLVDACTDVIDKHFGGE